MNASNWILLCGIHSLGFALFHIAFWKIFDWPRSLQGTTFANRAIIQILNLRLIYVLFGVSAACFVFTDELALTRWGRAFLGFMALFWIGRTIEQVIFLRINRPAVHVLTVLFVLGAVLFTIALLV